MPSLTASPSPALTGDIRVPGDKSISHRAVMLGALAVGRTTVSGLLEGEDVLATAAAFRAMGATVEHQADGTWTIDGVGLGGLREPAEVLDMGNSGTAARLLLGVLAGHPIRAFMTGDASLTKRPMNRVAGPLRQMGAVIETRSEGRLPLMIEGRAEPLPIDYELPVASAQVKSAVLLAGLTARGKTTVIEPVATRDHSERMLRAFGAEVTVTPEGSGNRITVTGQPELIACEIAVPSDPSSAAFPMVAALIVPGSDVTLRSVGMNPTRAGLIDTLIEMGGDIDILDRREEGGEPVADLRIRHSALKGISVPPDRAPSMIDEYPVLAVAASFATGATEMRGVHELRVKECDRLAATIAGLKANGVTCEMGEDWMVVEGGVGSVKGGGTVETHIDHRIAMSFLVMGLASKSGVTIDDDAAIATSFPGFRDLIQGLGGNL